MERFRSARNVFGKGNAVKIPPIRRSRRRQRGFTLVELLVVLVILSLITAAVGTAAMSFLGGAKVKSANIQIKNLSNVLDSYSLTVGRYPTESEGLEILTGPPIGLKSDQVVDPWQNPIVYRFPGNHGEYDLYSLGADGQEGGDGDNADITSWESK